MSRKADFVANAGESFGLHQLDALEDMADAAGFAGPGMPTKLQDEMFEYVLEKAEDLLPFFPDRADAARNLFIAKARHSYYGVRSTEGDRKRWARLAQDAYQELSLMETQAA